MPFRGVGQNLGARGFIKFFNSKFLNCLSAGDFEFLLNQMFNWKTVAVPSPTTVNTETPHRPISRNYVLNRACQNMAVMRKAGGKGRAVIKHKTARSFSLRDTLLKNLIPLPKLKDFFFLFG